MVAFFQTSTQLRVFFGNHAVLFESTEEQTKKDAAQSEEGAEINPAKVDTMRT